jgi:mannose PTS system EIIA component
MNRILLIAHAPLASALRACVAHVFPDSLGEVHALDIAAHDSAEDSLRWAQAVLDHALTPEADAPPVQGVLILTDVFGATPCNVAQKLVTNPQLKLIAGVNLPMLLRAVTYRHETLDALVARAIAGGTGGVMPVAVTAPQNQLRNLPSKLPSSLPSNSSFSPASRHDPDHHHHQQ